MKQKDNNKIHRTMIGGQAVIEGVMMRGVDKTALAVRKLDGSINLDVWDTVPLKDRSPLFRVPIIRGVLSFVEMLVYGYKTLSKSAEIATEDASDEGMPVTDDFSKEADTAESNPDEDAAVNDNNTEEISTDPDAAQSIDETTDTEIAPAKETAASGTDSENTYIQKTEIPDNDSGKSIDSDDSKDSETGNSSKAEDEEDGDGGISDKALDAVTIVSLVLGLVFAIFLFAILPTIIIGGTEKFVHWGIFRTLAEGVIKIAIFVAYLAVISCLKDIQRVYQYHGAEHKTICCYEHSDELTPENARKYTRFHPRCGTSFLLIVLIIGIIVFSFVTWKTLWLRIVLKLILLPLVVGISYEIIKFAGRHDNSVMRFLLAPGLWLQRLTTREPDDSQLEVAIKSLRAVLPDNPEDDKW